MASLAVSGFTRTQIIEMANRRTERRGASLDLNGEYLTALQEVCLERRWWWRRRIATFSLIANQSKYNLTDTTTLNMVDFQQVAKNGFKIYPPTANPGPTPVPAWNTRYKCPEPVFDVDEQESILALQDQYPPCQPHRYFLEGATGQLVVDPIPDQPYPASIGYWAIPAYTVSNEDETIRLVPPSLHGLLIKRLEVHIERYAISEESEKYEAVTKEYGELLEKALLYMQFAEGEFREVRNRDHYDSIQST